MPLDKTWDSYKDQILCFLYQAQKITKWSQLSQIMADKYNIKRKTGKQCKQRYYQITTGNFASLPNEWTEEKDIQMFCIKKQFGNDWSKIAEILGMRDKSEIKNRFFCRIRKSIRLLKKMIQKNRKRGQKKVYIQDNFEIKIARVSNIELLSSNEVPEDFIKLGQEIQEQLFFLKQVQVQLQKLSSLISKIKKFDKQSKKFKKYLNKNIQRTSTKNITKKLNKMNQFITKEEVQRPFQDEKTEEKTDKICQKVKIQEQMHS